MKKFYDRHFRVNENEKIREHVMMMRIVLAVAVVCVSMCSMGITAYAFFTYTVTSSSNVIKAANFSLEKTVTDLNPAEGASDKVVKNEQGYYVLDASGGSKTFRLKLKTSAATTATSGFAKLEMRAGAGQTAQKDYFTKQIAKGTDFTIDINVPYGNVVEVKVVDNWGTCALQNKLASGSEMTPEFVVWIEEPIADEPETESDGEEAQEGQEDESVGDVPSDTPGDVPSDTTGDAPSDTPGDVPSDATGAALDDTPYENPEGDITEEKPEAPGAEESPEVVE